MEFNYTYKGSTEVSESGNNTQMSFSPDTKRPPTYFIGELRKNVAFREAISALHNVVVSDLRFQPKDRTAYQEWRSRQDELDWQTIAAQRQELAAKIEPLQRELNELYRHHDDRFKPYYVSRNAFRNYVFQQQLGYYWVFDPVITVHPDEVFFECFSQDESSYGRVGASYDVFKTLAN